MEVKDLDVQKKAQRISELEVLLEERTSATQQALNQLEKKNLLTEQLEFTNTKSDFSQKAARENTTLEQSGGQPSSSTHFNAAPLQMNDALLSFVSAVPSMGNSRISQSTTGHMFLGANGGVDQNFEAALHAK